MPRTAKLFTNGGSQAVRLPAEFRFEGTEVEIRRDETTGNVILSRANDRQAGWDEFFRMLDELQPGDIPEDFPFRDQSEAVDRKLFEDWDESELR